MTQEINTKYDEFYKDRSPLHVYPVEFVVRAFLGNYPRLSNKGNQFEGLKVLDLGFGDGRNMPLLRNLGFEVYGVEITEEICEAAQSRLEKLGVKIEAKEGRNSSIPYEVGFFDHVLACHACYYIDEGEKFDNNMAEIARVLRPEGRFTFSVPIRSSYIFDGAVDLGDGHMQIQNDPYGVRNGYVLKAFNSEDEIEGLLGNLFENFRIGNCRNDFWGIEEHVWTVVCDRK